ncbi:hypothetical protein QAD02_014620 [Eretmocerus hayati]|uniref:Uncharacterized protein n=1 Tax=Eretmocerus hayati TaxID=131215 RepID=A0ACC2P5U5_9HYME|nr:hypothetical protein QAD02_014620 [Eretmocerus hayati]
MTSHTAVKLSSANENFNFLKPEYMVGYNNDPYRNPREQLCLTKWNKEVLAKFRNGTANCVVATDVVDEGVDIPSCTLVIRYYAPQDFRAYIQSKGRARHSTSHYIILAPDSQYMSRHQSYKTTEQYLHSALHGKSDSRSKPTDEEIDDILYSRDIEPYSILKEDGTRSVITEQTAVSLINIYCASLLKSKFIMLAPAWVKSEIQTSGALLYQVSLTLPPISPVRDTVIGNAFDSLDIAKRSAAMKACIKLHHLGEFDDNLLPKRVEDVLKNTDYLFPFMEEEEEQVPGACPGTASKKRRHPLYYPEALSAGLPKEGDSVNYLHIIRMRPTYPKPDESRHVVFYNLLDDGATFGILSTKKFPSIPSFPIYMNVGDLQIGLDVNIEVPHLMQSQIELLKKFHFTIFTDVVPVLKDFMLFDRENLENCYLVCPVNAQSKIDWESIEKYQSVSTVTPEKPLKVTSSEYEMALVRPTYRASHVYVVTSVCEYLFASSSFPTRDFKSYTHYYKERHDIEIEDENQPLLEVKPISKKINCIKPRHITGQISRRKLANLTEDFEEHLVPELCEILNFPSVYWLKGSTLPSILHRITQLLTAEEFRVTIFHEAGLNLTTPEAGRQWEPVSIEMSGEQTSSVADSTLDESAIDEEMDTSCVLTRDVCVEVDVLSEEHGLYSWSRKEEPCDLERLADTVQLIDIEYYHKFMCNSSSADVKSLKLQNKIKSNYKKVTLVPVPGIKMLNRTNPYGPSPADILQNCLTAKSAHDAFNFERSETLGDSFLKFATSLFLFHQYQMYEEGPLTFLKGKIVGNLNLYRCGTQKNLAGRMNFEEFNANGNFVTPAYIVDRVMRNLIFDLEISPSILYEISIPTVEKFYGMMSNITRDTVQNKFLSWTSEQATQATGLEHFLGVQVIPDKSVADCVEAVIGTYLLHVGVEGALNIVKWFQILPKTLDMHGLLYGDIPNPRLGVGEIDKLMPWADAIESRIGYKFKNRALLLQAFTHPSFLENRITGSYQRLEFLGDAILDFLLTAHIYETCGNLDPGELTDLRSALVNNITFACLAVRYGLNTALLSHAPKLFEAIDRFVKFQEERDYEVNDELLWILLEEEECQISEHVDVPKALGDIFESVIGAIFLDLKKDLQKTWQVIYCLMKKEIDLFSRNVPKQPIRVIHETPGAHPKFSVAEKVETSSTMMVTLSVIINGKRKYFHGFGTTKKLAKCAASKLALKHLRHKRE